MYPKSRRAQTVFLDLFFAVGFFLLLIGLVLITSINLKYKSEQNMIKDDLEREAILISDMLVQGPGYPSSWESNRSVVETFGLAGIDHQIQFSKLLAFKRITDSDYNKSKQILGIENEDFFVQMRYKNGTILATTGNLMPQGHVVNMKRAVVYNNNEALLVLAIWRAELE